MNDAGTNAEQSETGGEFRVTNESRRVRQSHYREHQVQRQSGYRGCLEDLEVEEVRVLFEEMLKYSGVCRPFNWPLPPKGLPGFLHSGYEPYGPEAKLIRVGLKYLYAIVNNEGRAMHLRWRDAGEMIRRIEQEAEERVYLKIAENNARQEEMRRAAQAARVVYFIGAESGPIKIGIAANPMARLSSLQTGHHERLSILATCGGGARLERAYHKRYANHRLNGEWFTRCRAILNEIDRLNELALAA